MKKCCLIIPGLIDISNYSFQNKKTKGQIVKTRMKVCETHTFLTKGNTICVLMEKRNISSF